MTTGDPFERGIELIDFQPVRILRLPGPRMQGGNGRLHLIGARLPVAHGLVDQGKPFGDHRLVPQAAVLIVQQNDRAFRVESGLGAGVLQQQEGSQPHDLRFRRENAQEQARQPDRLVAQWKPRRHFRAAC